MIALGIRYLTGYAAATNSRQQPEWPPHWGFACFGVAPFPFGMGSFTRTLSVRWLFY